MQLIKNINLLPPSYYTRFVVFLVVLMLFLGVIPVGMAKESVAQIEGANPQELVIDMESYVFTPAELTIERGKPMTLILRNQSFLVPHNFLLENPHGVRILEADISSGESQAHVLTLTESGMYPFYCDKQLLFFPTHREEGMEGRLIVP
ncbi:MAG: cupredoxin domain-containing protein [Nitrospirales bacterium]